MLATLTRAAGAFLFCLHALSKNRHFFLYFVVSVGQCLSILVNIRTYVRNLSVLCCRAIGDGVVEKGPKAGAI